MDIENLDLGKLFRIIKRYLFLIIGCAVGCAVIAILYTVFLITPKYQSYATLIVNNNNSSSLSDGSTITNDQINSAKQLVDTYSVILKSESVMDKVITLSLIHILSIVKTPACAAEQPHQQLSKPYP